MKNYYYDFHCHTNASPDSPAKLDDMVLMAKKRGLTGIAITDHNIPYSGPTKIKGIDIIPGTEVDLSDGNHILCYFVHIIKAKSLKRLIEEVRKQGGYAFWAHPLRKENSKERIKEILSLVDGIEHNAMDDFWGDDLKRKLEEITEEKIGINIAGSDSHVTGQIGTGVIRTDKRLKRENFKEVLKNGDILIRKEVLPFKKDIRKLRHIKEKVEGVLKINSLRPIRFLYERVFLRNFLRFKNMRLKEEDFSF